MSKPVRKAIITAAGFGSRWLPITKSLQKEMLPVLRRPIIDYIVEDCVKAGITEIIILISTGNDQVKDYYATRADLVYYLQEQGKYEQYEQYMNLYDGVKFTFVEDNYYDLPYGTYKALVLGREALAGEDAFLMCTGDDFVAHGDKHSEAQEIIKLYESTKAAAIMSCVSRPAEILHKYGVIKQRLEEGIGYLEKIVEKPAPGTAPSDLVNISAYLFTSAIFEEIEKQRAVSLKPEHILVETLEIMASKQPGVAVHTTSGEYLDSGDVLGWLKANLYLAGQDPALRAELTEYLFTW